MQPFQGLSEVTDCCADPGSVKISVYVEQISMPSSRLSRASRRFLLTASIWSAIVIVLVFFVTYTILLVCVDRPFQIAHRRQNMFPGSTVNNGRPKVRFLGKGVMSGDEKFLNFSSEFTRRKKVWDPGQLDDLSAVTPKCRLGSLFIIIITSSPDHFEHRTAVRNTWCNMSSSENAWQCLFLIGQTNDSHIGGEVRSESQRFGDIVRGRYVDSYRNLTHKVMHGLSWVSRHCPVPFILKTDDDCFVNAGLFRHFLLHHNTRTTNLYAGNMLVNKNRRKVIRRASEKWSVSENDYRPEYYPVYASGSGYALSLDTVTNVVEESMFKKPIPNEDAYIGIVVDSLGVDPTYSGRFILSSAGLRLCNYLYIFVAHGVQPGTQEELHGKAAAAHSECHDQEEVTEWF